MCICVCVWLFICICACSSTCEYALSAVCVLIAACVESGVRRWDFSSRSLSLSTFLFIMLLFSLLQSFSSSPSYSSRSCCLSNSSRPPHSSSCFFSLFPHLLFVQLHLCPHFPLIVLPFCFLSLRRPSFCCYVLGFISF